MTDLRTWCSKGEYIGKRGVPKKVTNRQILMRMENWSLWKVGTPWGDNWGKVFVQIYAKVWEITSQQGKGCPIPNRDWLILVTVLRATVGVSVFLHQETHQDSPSKNSSPVPLWTWKHQFLLPPFKNLSWATLLFCFLSFVLYLSPAF